jgi:hypothetical protein
MWKWFYAPAEDRLYERQEDNWNVFSMEGGRIQQTNKRFRFQGQIDLAPQYRLRATVFPLDPGRFILSNYGWDAVPPVNEIPATLLDAIAQLPPESRWAVEQFDARDNGLRFAQAIQNGTAIALSDGSFKDE